MKKDHYICTVLSMKFVTCNNTTINIMYDKTENYEGYNINYSSLLLLRGGGRGAAAVRLKETKTVYTLYEHTRVRRFLL